MINKLILILVVMIKNQFILGVMKFNLNSKEVKPFNKESL